MNVYTRTHFFSDCVHVLPVPEHKCSSASIFPVQVSVLFLFFLLISVCFDTLIGFLHWCNHKLGGPKPLWLEELQEELLDLGVISLVLVFVEVGPNWIRRAQKIYMKCANR